MEMYSSMNTISIIIPTQTLTAYLPPGKVVPPPPPPPNDRKDVKEITYQRVRVTGEKP